jgi:hypothetical protein
VWKELREQWAVWLGLALATAGAAAGLIVLMAPGFNRLDTLVGLFWFAAWGYGLVCGCLLLAGEVEDDTQEFLDTLPVSRRRLWGIKAGTGLALLAAQLVAVSLVGYAFFHNGYSPSRTTGDLAYLLLAAGVGYGWGLYCGSFAPNVLNAVGWAVLLQVLTGLTLLLVVALPVHAFIFRSAPGNLPAVWVAAAGLAALVAAVRSRAVYGRPDRLREAAAAPRIRGAVRPGWPVLFWLAWRQARGFALGMSAFAVLGAATLIVLRVAAWPLLTLVLGILSGVTTFADEQQSGAFRLTGDQRLPLGRLWFVKIVTRLAVGLVAAGLMALGVLIAIGVHSASVPRENLEVLANDLRLGPASAVVAAPLLFATLWLVNGFAVGVFFGMLFKKPVVAGAVSIGVAGPLVSVWIPSLVVTGGLHAWQVFGVPVVLLVTTRLLMRAWTAGRLASARVAYLAAAGGVASVAWMAAALWFRVTEIPRAPEAIDVAAFEAGLPPVDKNTAGRLTWSALRRMAEREDALRNSAEAHLRNQARVTPGRPAPDRLPSPPPTLATYVGMAERVAQRGWEATDRKLGPFLDMVFGDPRMDALAEAARFPTGVTFDPRAVTSLTAFPEAIAPKVALFLVADGLRRQHDGDPAAFVDRLRTGLALARNLSQQSTLRSVEAGASVESQMARGVERWLERLDGRPDLLQLAREVLAEHAAAPPTDWEEVRKAEFIVGLNALSDPTNLSIASRQSSQMLLGVVRDPDFLRFSLQVPWEKARLRRLLDALASHDAGLRELARRVSPAPILFGSADGGRVQEAQRRRASESDRCVVAASMLRVALRLYQAEKGKPAEKLADLVPEYLQTVPTDPLDGRPIRYRLSRGETLNWPPADLAGPAADGNVRPVRRVPAGEGILWCAGADGRDHGGHTQVSPIKGSHVPDADVIYLVPVPPRK